MTRFLDEIFVEECLGTVLEIGSGTSQFNELFERYLPSYVATDINREYIKVSKKRLRNTHFTICSSQQLPFPRNSFDRVFALFMFHHLTDDEVRSSLKEVCHCLKDDGKLVLVDPFLPSSRLNLLGWILGKIDRGRHVRKRTHLLELFEEIDSFKWSEIVFKEAWPYDMSVYICDTGRADHINTPTVPPC